jgi:hypothetical protein
LSWWRSSLPETHRFYHYGYQLYSLYPSLLSVLKWVTTSSYFFFIIKWMNLSDVILYI